MTIVYTGSCNISFFLIIHTVHRPRFEGIGRKRKKGKRKRGREGSEKKLL